MEPPLMANVLDTIVASKRQALERRQREIPMMDPHDGSRPKMQ
jgi:hypothetical protein